MEYESGNCEYATSSSSSSSSSPAAVAVKKTGRRRRRRRRSYVAGFVRSLWGEDFLLIAPPQSPHTQKSRKRIRAFLFGAHFFSGRREVEHRHARIRTCVEVAELEQKVGERKNERKK